MHPALYHKKLIASNVHWISGFEPTISNSLTAVQAKRELLIIRKRIKAKTKCKNWENVLQGDYINDIIANKISNVDEFQDWLNTLEG